MITNVIEKVNAEAILNSETYEQGEYLVFEASLYIVLEDGASEHCVVRIKKCRMVEDFIPALVCHASVLICGTYYYYDEYILAESIRLKTPGGFERITKVYQYCDRCDTEVLILDTLDYQLCPECGSVIHPCDERHLHPDPAVACDDDCDNCGELH